MIYLDHVQILLPCFTGEMITVCAEVTFTASHCLEMSCLVFSEDIHNSQYMHDHRSIFPPSQFICVFLHQNGKSCANTYCVQKPAKVDLTPLVCLTIGFLGIHVFTHSIPRYTDLCLSSNFSSETE